MDYPNQGLEAGTSNKSGHGGCLFEWIQDNYISCLRAQQWMMTIQILFMVSLSILLSPVVFEALQPASN